MKTASRSLASAGCLAAALGIAAGAAAEEKCGQWYASVSELSGEGTAMNARTCSEEGNLKSYFEITCFGKTLNVRFLPELGDDAPDFSGKKKTLTYSVDGQKHSAPSQFEELDGAFASNLAAGHACQSALNFDPL